MNLSCQSEKLLVVAADRDIEEAMEAILGRPESVGMRRVDYECRRHPGRDGGCRTNASQFVRTFQKRFSHTLVVFDREGCGSPQSRVKIERHVEGELARNGWGNRGKAIAIDPELEAWMWSNSPEVPRGLGWGGSYGELRSRLHGEGLWEDVSNKPGHPKEALRRTLVLTRRRKSARIYGEILAKVSLMGCRDPAFCKMRTLLQDWFPRATNA